MTKDELFMQAKTSIEDHQSQTDEHITKRTVFDVVKHCNDMNKTKLSPKDVKDVTLSLYATLTRNEEGVTMSQKLLKECIGLMIEATNDKERIGYALDQYLGVKVTSLEIVPDPGVPGTYAVRAQWRDSDGQIQTQDFIVTGVVRGGMIDINTQVEEVEFKSWPPRSRY